MSYTERNLLGLRVQVTAENWDGTVEVRGSLFGLSDNLGLLHWDTLAQGEQDNAIFLHSRTRASGIEVALASELRRLDGAAESDFWDVQHLPTTRLRTRAVAGQPVTITKTVTVVDSRHSNNPLAEAQQLLARSRRADFDDHVRHSARGWLARWDTSDVQIDGDDEAQVAIRHAIFQILAVGPQEERDDANIG
jgi:kojibiose phosphorylase